MKSNVWYHMNVCSEFGSVRLTIETRATRPAQTRNAMNASQCPPFHCNSQTSKPESECEPDIKCESKIKRDLEIECDHGSESYRVRYM